MIPYTNMIRILSDTIMVFSAAGLIDSFGISKFRDLKHKLFAASACLLLAVLFSGTDGPASVTGYFLMFITAFIAVFPKIRLAHIYIALMSEFITSILSSCLYSLICTAVSFDIKEITLLTVRLVLMLTVLVMRRSEKVRRIHLIIKVVPKHIFVLTALSVMFISFLSENNSINAANPMKMVINALLLTLLTLSLIAIIFSLLINVVAKKQFSDTNLLLAEMVDTQLRHYERLEKLNSDIRSFKHDYINHIRSISSLLEMEQYGDAKEYTQKLTSASPAQNFSFQTGNHLADAVLTDKNDLCGETAKIIFYGFIPDKIDNADLCVILSNALDNAAEACADCEGQSRIEICAQERQGYFALTVRNPTSDRRSYSDIPDTSKTDALNHGFGLRNIDAVVKKHDGRLSIKCENMVFELSLTIKL